MLNMTRLNNFIPQKKKINNKVKYFKDFKVFTYR